MDLKSQVLIAVSRLQILQRLIYFIWLSFGLKPKNGKILGQKDEEEKTCYSKSRSVKVVF